MIDHFTFKNLLKNTTNINFGDQYYRLERLFLALFE